MLVFLLSVLVHATDGLTDCTPSRITYYEGFENNGACEFGPVTGLGLPQGMYTAAPNELFLDHSRKCGACYEIVGPKGTTRFMVTDKCPAKGNEKHCSGDMVHFDMGGKEAFSALADPTVGVTNTTFRMIPCGLSGNVKIQLKDGSSVYWIGIIPRNFNIPVKTVEVSVDNKKTWVEIERKESFFAFSGDGSAPLPYFVRLTSIGGDAAVVTLSEITSNAILTADRQFDTPKDTFFDVQTLEPKAKPANPPTCCAAPDVWSTVYDDKSIKGTWSSTSWGANINTECTERPASGASCLRAQCDAWGALQVHAKVPAPLSVFSHVRFKVRGEETRKDAVIFRAQKTTDRTLELETVAGEWVEHTVELQPYVVGDQMTDFSLQNNAGSGKVLDFDEIVLVKKDNTGDECQPPVGPVVPPSPDGDAGFFVAFVCIAVLLLI